VTGEGGTGLGTPAALAELEARCRGVVEAAAGDTAHDLAHVTRVVHTARRLAEEEGARMEVVIPAAWLHDCVTVPKDSPLRPHASRMAAERAVELLREWGVGEALLPGIAHAIEAHSFTAGIEPRTLEARVVRDADRLDALGAVGLARCLMLAGAMGQRLYDPDDPFCEARPADDGVSAVDHFHTKLLRLHATFTTRAARREAEVRTRFLRDFLDRLRAELPEPAPANRGSMHADPR
jgi:uncharacterized protein